MRSRLNPSRSCCLLWATAILLITYPLLVTAQASPVGSMVDHTTSLTASQCPTGTYLVRMLVQSGQIADASCNATTQRDGTSLITYMAAKLGPHVVKSIEEPSDLPIWLDLLEFGCSDPSQPLQISLVNSIDGKTCFSDNVANWRNIQPMDVVGGAPKTLSAVTTDVYTQVPFRVASNTGMSWLDLRLLTTPGTLPEATTKPLDSATAGIIFSVVAVFTLAFILGYFWQYRVQILTRLGIRKDTPADPYAYNEKQPSASKVAKASADNKV